MHVAQPHLASTASATSSTLRGIWLPLVTPLRRDGADTAVDHAALRRLVAHYRHSGIAGLVICGTTGEAAALDDAEQLAVFDTVLCEAGSLPVIAGLAGNHLGHTLARLDALNGLPLCGVLSPAPYYIRPSQAGLLDWFHALADRSRAPLVLYDIPYRTGATLTLDTLLTRIAETEAAIAIIDITGVPTVDTLVAQHLIKTVTAIRLMGADCIISGVRPQIAQTIVHLGVDLGEVTTKANLADALALALKRTGVRVVSGGEAA